MIQTERYAFIVEVKRQKSIGQKAMDEIAAKVSALPRRKTVSVRTALVYDGELETCVRAKRAFDFLVPSEEIIGL